MSILEEYVIHHSACSIPRCEYVENDIEIDCDECQKKMIEEHDNKIRAEVIEKYKEQLLKDLIPLKNKYFDIARGTAMPERYTHLKRMDTVDMIIETVNLIAEQLKEQK